VTTTEPVTIYERLGAEGGIRRAVDEFYERVLADAELAPFFEGIDMKSLRRHQVDFLTAATGGPNRYDGRDVAAAHAGRGITGEHFDRVVGHLVGTLQSAGVDEEPIGQVGAALTPLRSDIVSDIVSDAVGG
jgi:hemoglobin